MALNILKQASVYEVIGFGINYIIPRIFGLVPFSIDLNTSKLNTSKQWNLYCILIGTICIYFYPRAIYILIFRESTSMSLNQSVEALQYLATYLLTAAIYIRNITLTQEVADYINEGHDVYILSKDLCKNDVKLMGTYMPYIGRAVCSYVGHIVLNTYRLGYLLRKNKTFNWFNKIIYYLPDIAITSSAIRFHTSLLAAILVMRRVNLALEQVICDINRQAYGPLYRKSKVFRESERRIDKLMAFTVKAFRIMKNVEITLGVFILCLIGNAVMNITSLVITFLDLIYHLV